MIVLNPRRVTIVAVPALWKSRSIYLELHMKPCVCMCMCVCVRVQMCKHMLSRSSPAFPEKRHCSPSSTPGAFRVLQPSLWAYIGPFGSVAFIDCCTIKSTWFSLEWGIQCLLNWIDIKIYEQCSPCWGTCYSRPCDSLRGFLPLVITPVFSVCWNIHVPWLAGLNCWIFVPSMMCH